MSLRPEQRAQLNEIAGVRAAFDEPMSRHTTLKIGGPADAYLCPDTPLATEQVLRYCWHHALPVTAIGAGSNLLVRDGGVRGVVIATRSLRQIERCGNILRVEAGVSTGKLLSVALGCGLGGVEFLGGVPGSVGGGLRMNAGTTLGEFKDVTQRVVSLRRNGERIERTHAECGFGYRSSLLPPDEVIVCADLQLAPRPLDLMKTEIQTLRSRRKEREPRGVHNAGSTFKNPPDGFAGQLIESAGLKGTRVGDAMCSPVHANWLVNVGAATSRDFLDLIRTVQSRVLAAHGVALELELRILGDDGLGDD